MAEPAEWPTTAFPPGGYEELIYALLDRGYLPVKLHEIDPDARHMFLRHDVDVSMSRAVEIARREAAIGVQSTFYVLLSTRFYNLASAEGRRALREIASLGHAIGLHFDTTQYAGSIEALEAAAAEECALLEQIAGGPVDSLSFHRPAPELLGLAGAYAGRRHAYEPAFFNDIAYISDSNGGWHYGHPLAHPAIQGGRAVQLLTHPIWWCSSESRPAVEVLEALRREEEARFVDDLRGTVKAYREWSLSTLGA